MPISFSIDANGHTAVDAELVTPLGEVRVDAKGEWKDENRIPLSDEPADVAQLIICYQLAKRQVCEAYQIGTGRTIRVIMNGSVVAEFERSLIKLDADLPATVRVEDVGPPPSHPARPRSAGQLVLP